MMSIYIKEFPGIEIRDIEHHLRELPFENNIILNETHESLFIIVIGLHDKNIFEEVLATIYTVYNYS